MDGNAIDFDGLIVIATMIVDATLLSSVIQYRRIDRY